MWLPYLRAVYKLCEPGGKHAFRNVVLSRHAAANFGESAEGNGEGDLKGAVTSCNAGFFGMGVVSILANRDGFGDFGKLAPLGVGAFRFVFPGYVVFESTYPRRYKVALRAGELSLGTVGPSAEVPTVDGLLVLLPFGDGRSSGPHISVREAAMGGESFGCRVGCMVAVGALVVGFRGRQSFSFLALRFCAYS
jgi:hypothetical protein